MVKFMRKMIFLSVFGIFSLGGCVSASVVSQPKASFDVQKFINAFEIEIKIAIDYLKNPNSFGKTLNWLGSQKEAIRREIVEANRGNLDFYGLLKLCCIKRYESFVELAEIYMQKHAAIRDDQWDAEIESIKRDLSLYNLLDANFSGLCLKNDSKQRLLKYCEGLCKVLDCIKIKIEKLEQEALLKAEKDRQAEMTVRLKQEEQARLEKAEKDRLKKETEAAISKAKKAYLLRHGHSLLPKKRPISIKFDNEGNVVLGVKLNKNFSEKSSLSMVQKFLSISAIAFSGYALYRACTGKSWVPPVIWYCLISIKERLGMRSLMQG